MCGNSSRDSRRKGDPMGYRILIVDDSPAMRALVRRVIQLSGFDLAGCLEAADGEQALKLLRAETVDAILTDINMPGMDGEEFLRRLSADPSLRPVPVLVISTDATANRIARMLSLGARDYMAKPFLPETLRAQLEHLLEVPCA
jgi:two-component system chemotaxis response regulator CheY